MWLIIKFGESLYVRSMRYKTSFKQSCIQSVSILKIFFAEDSMPMLSYMRGTKKNFTRI